MEARVPAPVVPVRRLARRTLARWLFALLALAGAQAGLVRRATDPRAPGDESSSLPLATATSCGAAVALPVAPPASAATAAAGGDSLGEPERLLTSVARAVPLPPSRSS